MLLRKIVFSITAVFLIVSSNAQNKALDAIDKNDLKNHLTIIASDSLMGRQIGADDNGLDMAADYIKTTIEKIGLAPVNGSYFQPVEMYVSKPDPENTVIQVSNKNGKLLFKSDSLISLSDSDINIENADVVFAGFGIDPKVNKNSDKMVFSGKVVMMMAGTKDMYKKGRVNWNERAENEKIKIAEQNGAVGVILVNTDYDKANDQYSHIERRMNENKFGLEKPKRGADGNNSILITTSVADNLLGGKGQLENRLSKMNKKKNKSFEAENVKVSINSPRINKQVPAKNIMGMIEGSDPELKNEYVVLMAHYDHLGRDESGDIYNGADDNGSGVVSILEVADAWMHTPEKPKRSVLFLWVTGEEIGMFGSNYYTMHPAFPLEKTVTCINIDMDGRVYEPRDSVWKDSPKKVKDFDGLYTLTDDIWPGLKEINSEKCRELGLVPDYSLPSNFLRSSDHYYFHNSGVPILNLATGYHYDYHKVTDEISRINFDKMKKVADLCYLVSYEIANLDKINIPEP